MIIFNSETEITELVHKDFMLLSVLNRFDIQLGFKEKTVGEICKEKSIDINLFLLIVNTHYNDKYVPNKSYLKFPFEQVMSYLLATHKMLIYDFIPRINTLFLNILNKDCSGHISMVNDVYAKAQEMFACHIKYEDEVVYPYVFLLYKGEQKRENEIIEFIENSKIKCHEKFKEEIHDLINVILKYSNTICEKEISELITTLLLFKRELIHHMKVEDRVFYSVIDKFKIVG